MPLVCIFHKNLRQSAYFLDLMLIDRVKSIIYNSGGIEIFLKL